jgi:lipopolysaccharide export LptBFGC system permease protein LptF
VNSGLYFFAILIGLGWQIRISFQEKSFLRWLQLANACALSASLMFQLVDWLIVPATMWILIVLSSRGMRSFDRGVALLFYFIICSVWISGYFFGADAVYYSL